MPQISFETTIEREDDSIDVAVIYSVSAYRPAVLYGDYPQPAEGGEVELHSVVLCGSDKDAPQFELSEGETALLIEEIESRASEDLQDEEASRGDYLYDQQRDERMMDDWAA